ncbi:MAG: hypothetical protein Q8900_03855 [Bacillota bacterium]|nr:hypothetical protein [Bacillota bacterium]
MLLIIIIFTGIIAFIPFIALAFSIFKMKKTHNKTYRNWAIATGCYVFLVTAFLSWRVITIAVLPKMKSADNSINFTNGSIFIFEKHKYILEGGDQSRQDFENLYKIGVEVEKPVSIGIFFTNILIPNPVYAEKNDKDIKYLWEYDCGFIRYKKID